MYPNLNYVGYKRVGWRRRWQRLVNKIRNCFTDICEFFDEFKAGFLSFSSDEFHPLYWITPPRRVGETFKVENGTLKVFDESSLQERESLVGMSVPIF